MDSNNSRYRYVKTRPILVEALLVEGIKVEGYLHLTTDHRLVDQLNNQTKETPFVALSDAKVLLPGGEWRQCDFFTVNRYKIICCIPKESTKT